MRFAIPALLLISLAQTVSAQQVMQLTFEDPLPDTAQTAESVRLAQPGPRPPEYPGFSATNQAVHLGGKGARIMITDPGDDSIYDFGEGDEVTLEAWVQLDKSAGGSGTRTIISKGRTHQPGFPKDNQNWALRLSTGDGLARLNFLFATSPKPNSAHWHRWTSDSGFQVDSGWHHIAIVYRFGEPGSLQGWVDGLKLSGTWDLGGPTTESPVPDNDAIWIGSSMAGNAGNSMIGSIDEIRIHRRRLSEAQITARFERVGGPRVLIPLPPEMPQLGTLARNKVTVILSEGMASERRWQHLGEPTPEPQLHYATPSMLLGRIPARFDSTGIRTGWKAPLLVTMATDAKLPAGQLELLLRVRALSRLWIDGQLIVETEPIVKQPPNGEEPVTPIPVPLVPGQRIPGYHQQQHLLTTELPASPDSDNVRRIVLEMLVGGSQLRVETGEITLAYRDQPDQIFQVVSPAGTDSFPLTDPQVEPRLQAAARAVEQLERQTRRTAAAASNDFWEARHQHAEEWAAAHSEPVPDSAASHPIDAFLNHQVTQALRVSAATDPAAAQKFHSTLLPLLKSRCFRCHGDQDKGGLRLNSREGMMSLGDSGSAPVIPGDAHNSLLVERIRSDDDDVRMPPGPDRLSAEQVAMLTDWIDAGAIWPSLPITPQQVSPPPTSGDFAFVRRAYLDLTGVAPTIEEYETFRQQPAHSRRLWLIDTLLQDDRFADSLMGEWQDLLAENPTLLNQSQGSTGPFRFFLHDSFLDNKPLDRMITELLLMGGGQHEGGAAGFAMAAENDAPMAAKAHVLSAAFLGVDMQCARCHDAPYHSTTQKDLFSLAAMLQRKTTTVPASSRVPAAFFESIQARTPLIEVTLKPDEPVAPEWPFGDSLALPDDDRIAALTRNPDDSRERLAALITAPHNRRFAQVITNRVWARLLGRGLVEPLHDWEGRQSVNPPLLRWLGVQFVGSGYDLRQLFRLIMTSDVYQRLPFTGDRNLGEQYFPGPLRRRMSAEQIVDTLHQSLGVPMSVEPMTFVHDGRRALSNRQMLGQPDRAWMLASLNNERDRPSLSLPKARAVADVLQAFGWNGSRQMPVSRREMDPNLLQPGILANGVLTATLTRASAGSTLAQLAVEARSADDLLRQLFLRILTRLPSSEETDHFLPVLQTGFDLRILPADEQQRVQKLPPLPLVTWFNHQRHDANAIQRQMEQRVQDGPPADPRLRPEWREVYEDLAWSLINHSEFVWIP